MWLFHITLPAEAATPIPVKWARHIREHYLPEQCRGSHGFAYIQKGAHVRTRAARALASIEHTSPYYGDTTQ